MRILVIDDEIQICELLTAILKKLNYIVEYATNGVEAIEMQKTNQYDLLITDLVMPEKEGLEVIVEIKRFNPSIKIIAMSGAFSEGINSLATAKLLGADAIIKKPFDTAQILQIVHTVLSD